MHRLFCLLVVLVGSAMVSDARSQPPGQRFVAIAFHDVVDNRDQLETDSVTSTSLVQFFDWLKGTGWTAVSLDDVAAAARGVRPLPDKAILISFDDGYSSLYTRVFPLLRIYRFPIVAALVGSWMEGRPEGTVVYGDRVVPRSNFISWSQAREMQASGLVEFASHSYNLHRGVLANPQGNMVPAAITWQYDPATGSYEDDTQFRARIRTDLARARSQMATNLGRPPRALVWPFGRYSGPALEVAKQVRFTFALTLEPEPAYTSDLFAIHRYFPSQNPSLGDLARNLRFEPDRPATRRIACLTLDALAAVGPGAAQDEALGHIVEGLRALGTNTVVIDANVALPSPGAPLNAVYFPNRLLPMRLDLLSRATWQIRTRASNDVYLHLPLEAATAAVGEAGVPTLFSDMTRHTAADGLAIDAPAPSPAGPIVVDQPGDIRARRARLDPASFDGGTRLALTAFRASAAIDARQRLMLVTNESVGPPDWADIGLMPPSRDGTATGALAQRLRAEGWLRPEVSGRVAFTLPSDPARQVEALRAAQRRGASAFALCPGTPALPPAAALSAAFSAATYPYRP
ncbi:MAG TPA: poly-beta-1,6-N-acetyl-D-glucosamine N-deacetylase PgaB [Reyranella sp.]|nr:poly-beta-1,6-N-acetyl-D-glucosamine N-deacetylase PgaB [Reyranella sp.]